MWPTASAVGQSNRNIQPRSGERFVRRIFRHSVALPLLRLRSTPSRAWLHSDGPPGLNLSPTSAGRFSVFGEERKPGTSTY